MTHASRPPDHDHDSGHGRDDAAPLPDALRWQLRALRRDAPPQRDLWPDISARIAATASPAVARRTRRPLRWLAAAAALTLAVGLGWQLRPPTTAAPVAQITPATSQTPQPPPLVRQADALQREYQAALLEVEAARTARPVHAPAQLGSTLEQLDRSAAEIRTALESAPDAQFLLERLQQVYARRLALTRHLA